MSNLISVIVPVYNIDKQLLEKCINSISRQTYKNLEIIIVDDGSKKECADHCDYLASNDERINVIHQKNAGLSAARNTGLEIAKGDYFGFVDSDDYLELDMYEILYKAITEYNADISMVGFRLVYDGGTIKYRDYYKEDTFLKCEEAVDELFYDKLITSSACNKLFKSELWTDISFPIGKAFEDCRTMHKVFYKAKGGVIALSQCCYNYYQRDKSIMNSMSLDKALDEVLAWEEKLIFTKEYCPSQTVKMQAKLIKMSIKLLLNVKYQTNISKEEYIYKTAPVVNILDDENSVKLIDTMPKYKKSYEFLKKNRYSIIKKALFNALGGLRG